MASYDSPGYQDKLPGGAAVPQGTGAPGSAPGPLPATDALPDDLERGTVGYSAVVTIPGATLANADRVQVGVSDTLSGSQAFAYGSARDPLTGIGPELGQTGAGMGTDLTDGHHPNSMARRP